MKINILLLAALLISTTSFAHHLGTVSSIHYTIRPSINLDGSAVYDLAQGTVHFTTPDGTEKRYARAHMARSAPWNAKTIFGQITVDLANELAGTWYVYK